jgi:hypothetical protein
MIIMTILNYTFGGALVLLLLCFNGSAAKIYTHTRLLRNYEYPPQQFSFAVAAAMCIWHALCMTHNSF